MRKKLLLTTALFFIPVLQKLDSTLFLGLKLDFQFFIICLSILLLIRIIAIIYFCLALIKWIVSGFQLNKLMPVMVSGITILFLNYSLKTIKNNWVKKTLIRFQRIPNVLLRQIHA